MERKRSWPPCESLRLAVGDHWAYRLHGDATSSEVAEVVVERLGRKRPSRALVSFVDDDYEGRREWVSPARLMVPWGRSGEWVANQVAWQEARARSRNVSWSVEALAVNEVLGAYEVAEADDIDSLEPLAFRYEGRETGVLVISDPLLIDRLPGRDVLLAAGASFTDAFTGAYVAPWPAALHLAKAIAREFGAVAAAAARESDEYYTDASLSDDDRACPHLGGMTWRALGQRHRESCTLVFSWCDGEAVRTIDELAETRTALKRERERVRRLLKTLSDLQQSRHMGMPTLRSVAEQVGVTLEQIRYESAYHYKGLPLNRPRSAPTVAPGDDIGT